MTQEDKRALYEIHRDYVKHEDHLINHRTTWLITVQAFLLATFGFSVQKLYEIWFNVIRVIQSEPEIASAMSSSSGLVRFSLLALSVVGFAVAIISLLSIRAASKAIESLNRNWKKIPSSQPQEGVPKSGDVSGSHPDEPQGNPQSTGTETGGPASQGHETARPAQKENQTRVDNAQDQWLPELIGGGQEEAHGSGKLLSLYLPVFFSFLWVTVFIAVCIVQLPVPSTPLATNDPQSSSQALPILSATNAGTSPQVFLDGGMPQEGATDAGTK